MEIFNLFHGEADVGPSGDEPPEVGVWTGGTHYMLRRSDHLEYWDGER